MVTKHFFKTLILFTGMILLGILGVFLIGGFEEKESTEKTATPVVK